MSAAIKRSQPALATSDGLDTASVRRISDWQPCVCPMQVRHAPTHTTFEFYGLPHRPHFHVLRVADFRARLLRVPDGYPQPTPSEHRRLCEEAPAIGLYFLGLVSITESATPNSLIVSTA